MSDTRSLRPRDRILRATADLLAEGGRDAVTTRAVSAAAGVQPQTIYRQFGDMRGLLNEVASQGFSTYLATKVARPRADDPVEDLRQGWDLHVAFGLANPALYALMYGEPRPGAPLAATGELHEVLHGLVQRVAEAGRLRIGVERAVLMVHASGVGVVLTLLAMPAPAENRGLALSNLVREAILTAITTDSTLDGQGGPAEQGRVSSLAVALKAVLPGADAEFSPAESKLLSEWLDRLSSTAG